MEIAAYRQPSVLRRKRASAGCEAFDVKKEAAFVVGNTERAREIFRQRFQSELDAVRHLLEKAAATMPVPRSEEPPAKRSRKASTSPVVARKTVAVEEEEEEDVNIVGGVSPLAFVPAPLQLAEDEDEDVDICGDASPVVMPKNLGDDATMSGSPSSSSSDSDSDSGSDSSSSSGSDSDSESDSDENTDGPSRAERDADLIMARAKEYLDRCRAREKARQEVLQTERTAMSLDNETVHLTVLESLGIAEYNMARSDSVLRQLGLFLKVDDDQEQHHRRHRQSFQEELEEGEIRM